MEINLDLTNKNHQQSKFFSFTKNFNIVSLLFVIILPEVPDRNACCIGAKDRLALLEK